MKLEVKHLAPYGDKGCSYSTREGTTLPFDFEDLYDIQQHITNYEDDEWKINYKLHLRPLSDVGEEMIFNGETFIPMQRLGEMHPTFGNSPFVLDKQDGFMVCVGGNIGFCTVWYDERNMKNEYWVVQQLLEWGFDVFGLIEAGHAIDVNTVLIDG